MFCFVAERAIPREIMKSDAESDAPMSSEIFFEISSQTTNWIANCISHLLLCRIKEMLMLLAAFNFKSTKWLLSPKAILQEGIVYHWTLLS